MSQRRWEIYAGADYTSSPLSRSAKQIAVFDAFVNFCWLFVINLFIWRVKLLSSTSNIWRRWLNLRHAIPSFTQILKNKIDFERCLKLCKRVKDANLWQKPSNFSFVLKLLKPKVENAILMRSVWDEKKKKKVLQLASKDTKSEFDIQKDENKVETMQNKVFVPHWNEVETFWLISRHFHNSWNLFQPAQKFHPTREIVFFSAFFSLLFKHSHTTQFGLIQIGTKMPVTEWRSGSFHQKY